MKKLVKALAVAFGLSVGSAYAATNLSFDANGVGSFSGSFAAAGEVDEFLFQLTSPSSVITTGLSLTNSFGSVALFQGSTQVGQSFAITLPNTFYTFGNLSAGVYSLKLTGGAAGFYNGSVTGATNSIAAVPEPETYAMLLAGLGMLGFMARRRIAA